MPARLHSACTAMGQTVQARSIHQASNFGQPVQRERLSRTEFASQSLEGSGPLRVLLPLCAAFGQGTRCKPRCFIEGSHGSESGCRHQHLRHGRPPACGSPRHLNKFLLAYQVLAATALQRQQLIWKLRPKHHYLCHLISETEQTGLNPMHMSNFLDEDHMKHLRAIVHSCHPAKVLTSWSKRYLLKKCFLLRRYTYSPQA